MNKFLNYGIKDYLFDESFRAWVKNGGLNQSNAEWTLRLKQDAAQLALALQARDILLATSFKEGELPPGYEDSIINRTLREIHEYQIKPEPVLRNWFSPWLAAASVACLLIGSWWLLSGKTFSIKSISELTSKKEATVLMQEKFNHTTEIMPVALPDGSSVLLQPESRLIYPSEFEKNQRVVSLTGQAFFEVTKDKNRPFLVLSKEMVTKVLGTSFTVSAFENNADFSVVVKTGKVSVSDNSSLGNNAKATSNATIDLLPNQQVVFDRHEHTLIRKEVTQKDIEVLVPPTKASYDFVDTPVTEIFAILRKAYGVSIAVDENQLANCALTTVLTDEPLFEKLKIICQGIGPGTSFSLVENQVVINSRGCN